MRGRGLVLRHILHTKNLALFSFFLFYLLLVGCTEDASIDKENDDFPRTSTITIDEAATVLESRFLFPETGLEYLNTYVFEFDDKDELLTYERLARIADAFYILDELPEENDDYVIVQEADANYSARVKAVLNKLLLDNVPLVEENVVLHVDDPISLYDLYRTLDNLTKNEDIRSVHAQVDGIPVLMYHRFYDDTTKEQFKGRGDYLDAESFKEQMRFLDENNVQTIAGDDLVSYLKGELQLDHPAVLITFDDGSRTIREHAYPIMKELDQVGISHIISARPRYGKETEGRNNLNWHELEEMEPIHEVGGHTHNLHWLYHNDRTSFLLHLPIQEVYADLNHSFELLNEPLSFAYPFGQYDERTITMLKEIGYSYAFTTQNGTIRLATIHTNLTE